MRAGFCFGLLKTQNGCQSLPVCLRLAGWIWKRKPSPVAHQFFTTMKKQRIKKTDIATMSKPCPEAIKLVTVQFNFKQQNFHIENIQNFCIRGMFDPNPNYHIIGFFESYKIAQEFIDSIREKHGLKVGHPY